MANVFANLILDVADIDRSLAFYHQLLELPVRTQQSVDGHRLAYLTTGQTEILLLQQPREEQNPHLERSGGLVIKFNVRNLPQVATQLKTKAVTVLRELDMAKIGERTFLVADPDGYAVLLSEPVETLN
ncbi:MAG TPA: VOC family protein [Fimbriimonadaceae bacterium]|jgi:lactoylglutathione lyase|nr:VOC family protein [Fimbriimonadaceae bacterium]